MSVFSNPNRITVANDENGYLIIELRQKFSEDEQLTWEVRLPIIEGEHLLGLQNRAVELLKDRLSTLQQAIQRSSVA